MKRLLASKTGEGYINTAVKIIIAVVVGALILGGIYLLFAGENGVMNKMNQDLHEMMDYKEEKLEIRIDISKKFNSIEYTYDGVEWVSSTLPDLGESAVILQMAQHEEMIVALVDNDEHTYIASSIDGGITWASYSFFSPNPVSTSLTWSDLEENFVVQITFRNRGWHLTSKNATIWTVTNGGPIEFT